MRVKYHGSLPEFHGMEFTAKPCDCVEMGYAMSVGHCDGERWRLSHADWSPTRALWHTRTESFTVVEDPPTSDEDENDCPGHESLAGDAMGVGVFCDGTCQTARWSA